MWRLWVSAVLLAIGVAVGGVRPSTAADPQGEVTASCGYGGPAGLRSLQPGNWGLVSVDVTNRSDKPVRLLMSMHFTDDPTLHYAREVWVPARCWRDTWCPIRLPESVDPDAGGIDITGLAYLRTDDGDQLLRRRWEGVVPSRPVAVDHFGPVTGIIIDTGLSEEVGPRDEDALEMIAAARMSALGVPKLSLLDEDFLPAAAEGLEGADLLVLMSDRLADDAAGLTAVRRWVLGGGRLWVMLDRVDPVTPETLLGDAFDVHVVDRVGLTRVEVTESFPDGTQRREAPRELEQPVELVRAVVRNVEVTHSVNGWPAAFWKRVGKGEVLFTTLGPHGWARPRTPHDPRAPKLFPSPRLITTPPLEKLSARLFAPRETPALKPEQLEPYLREQVGYRVVGRSTVAGVLGGFCLVLVLAGARLAKRNRLERLAYVAPGTAAAAAVVLIVLGFLAKTAVPPTAAMVQVITLQPGAEDVEMTGLVAMYHQEKSDFPVGARQGGVFRPDVSGVRGWTMVRTDLDAWHWENVVFPSGVRMAPLQYTGKMDRPVRASAMFGGEGLAGTLDLGSLEDPADVVLATPGGWNMAIDLDDQGGFAAGPDRVLTPGRFIDDALLSDDQRRRQGIYRQLLAAPDAGRSADYPVVWGWAEPLDVKFAFSEGARRVGSALWSVPLEIERTPPGTRVVIPSPFVNFRSIKGPDGKISAAYSNPMRQWAEIRVSTTLWLRFRVPEPVLPIELDGAVMTIEMNAPTRPVEVLGFAGSETVTVRSVNGPMDMFSADVRRTELLELDEGGGLLLAVRVGRSDAAGTSAGLAEHEGSSWQIESIRLELSGVTLEESP